MDPETKTMQQQVTAFWDACGDTYDCQPRHGILDVRERKAWLVALSELLPAPSADVLDVGTGTGFLAVLLADLGHRVTAIDLADGMMATARANAAGLKTTPLFQLGDAIDPPFAEASFDVVTNRHLLWTLLDPARAISRWYEILRPGGRLVAIDSLWEQERSTNRASRPHPGYSEEVSAAMPLCGIGTVDPVLDLARAAGFWDVRVVMLDEITRVEREVLPPSTPEIGDRYAVIGNK